MSYNMKGDVTLRNIIKKFSAYLKSNDLSDYTVIGYTTDLNKFSRWYLDTTECKMDISAVGPLDIAEFKRHLIDLGQKPATINRALTSLSVFFDWAVDKNIITENYAINIKKVRQGKVAPKSLSRKEQLALMRAVQTSGKSRDIAIVTLLLHTGLRVSELCALTPGDIVLRARSGTLTVRFGKGGKRREVPLNATARKALSGWLDKRGQIEGPLFTSQKGGGLQPRAVEHLINKYARQAGLENVSPHSLRHTFCKLLVDAGESLDRVAILAGHTNLNTTARYTRPSGRDLQKSVDRLAWE